MKHMIQKISPAWAFITMANAIPIVIWLMMTPLASRWTDSFQIFLSLGRLTAIVGYTLMATTIILATRLPLIEKQLLGLNRVLINHHRLGAISFLLLLAHPLFLTGRFLSSSTRSAALFLLPNLALWPQFLGTVSLALMMTLLIITFYLAWRYQIWKFSHRFLVVAFLVGFLHTAFITSDVSSNLALRIYLLTFGGLALIAYGYRLLVEFGHFGQHQFTISNKRSIGANTLEISLAPLQKNFSYRAGQFAFLSFSQPEISAEPHPFSFISDPTEKDLKFAIKNLGDFTATLDRLEAGTKVAIEGPHGAFGQDHLAGRREIWIAGGVGITPFISLAKDLKNNNRRADLFLSFKNQAEAIYLPELQSIADNNPRLKIFPFYSDTVGFLSADYIEKNSGPVQNRSIYICGPAGLMKTLKAQFVSKGANITNIHTEEFSLEK